MALTQQNFSMYQGEAKQINYVFTNSNDDPLDLTGGTLYWVLARNTLGGVLLTKTNGNGITVVAATGGTARLNLLLADTSGLQGDFYHEIRFINSGSLPTVLNNGYATIIPSPSVGV